MPAIPGILGPTNQSRSINMDPEDTFNFYPELHDAGTPKARVALYGTPAYRPFVVLDPGPMRAIFSQDGRVFAVSGGYFYEVFANHTAVLRGAMATNTKQATISSNGLGGNQLFVVSANYGYIYELTADTLTQIADPNFPFPALWGEFINSFFIVLAPDRFQLSALLNGTIWPGLNTAQVSLTSDRKVAMRASHTELWLFGTARTESWSNTGAANFPFQPTAGAPIDHGIAAPASAVIMDNTIFWLGKDETGAGVVWRASGYTPVRISTFAVEKFIGQLDRIDDAIGWSYLQEGHLFYVLYLPHASAHLVYDVASNMWHKRAIWDNTLMRWIPDVGRCHAFGFDKHLVGDRNSGAIYEMTLDQYDNQITWL